MFYPFYSDKLVPLKVMTDIVKTYPVSTTPENIRLYGLNDTVPNSAEVIGKVAVVDNGASTNCKYDQVLELAKKETSKYGGNALSLTEHKEPSIWGSSCHQIAGMMLYLSDTIINNYQPNSFYRGKRDKKRERKRMRPTPHTIYANIGYAWMTSKFYLPSGASGNLKKRPGLANRGIRMGFESGFGCGLLYSGYRSSYDISSNSINVGLTLRSPSICIKTKNQ